MADLTDEVVSRVNGDAVRHGNVINPDYKVEAEGQPRFDK
jgi:hypothetical protein